MKLDWHIPAGAVGLEPKDPLEFNTLEEIETATTRFQCEGFSNLAISYRDMGKPLLMAVYDNGYKWWVIGYLDATAEELNALGLPTWEAKYEEADDDAELVQ